MNSDEYFMDLALNEARKGIGLTRPNPPVGAVLVRNNRIIATGWHKVAGGAHAERNCIAAVQNEDLSDTTLFITLEPCSTYGRTPPCSSYIIENNIKRVVIGTLDPNKVHAGKGVQYLIDAGIEVSVGICEESSERIIEPFKSWILRKRPFVTLKLAVTLDGKIADCEGESKWITGDLSREWVQELRRNVDAIMVGANTIRKDNPSLLPRPDKGRFPWRVIMGGNIENNAQIFSDQAFAQTLIRTGCIKKVLDELAADYNIMHLLCEGGSGLAAQFLELNLVDELVMIYAPKVLGSDGYSCIDIKGRMMDSLIKGHFVHTERIGDDLIMRVRFGD